MKANREKDFPRQETPLGSMKTTTPKRIPDMDEMSGCHR